MAKIFKGETGGREMFISDINNLQDSAQQILEMYREFGNFIISGCNVSESGTSEGYIILNGYIRKVEKNNSIGNYYLVEKNYTQTVPYVKEQSKVGVIVYDCELTHSEPSSDDIDEVTGKPKQYIYISKNNSENKTFKTAVMQKYAVMKTTANSSEQTIDTPIIINGELNVKNSITTDSRFNISNSSGMVEISNEGISSRSSTNLVTNHISFSDKGIVLNGHATFDETRISLNTHTLIPNLHITNTDAIGDAIKINSGKKNLASIEIYNGVLQKPIVTISDSVNIQSKLSLDKEIVINNSLQTNNNEISSKINFCDADNISMFSVGVNGQNASFTTFNKHIIIDANNGKSNVSLKYAKLMLNDIDINEKYADKKEFGVLSENAVVKVDGMGLSQNSYTDDEKSKLENISTGKINAESNGYVVGKDVHSSLLKKISVDKKLSDLNLKSDDDKRIVCNNIGAMFAESGQTKLKTVAWTPINHHTNGTMPNLKVKQFGANVSVSGVVNIAKRDGNDLIGTLPNDIDLPTMDVVYRVSDISKKQGNYGFTLMIKAGENKIRVIEQSGDYNTSVIINMNYLI